MNKQTVTITNNLLHNTHIELADAQALGRQHDTFNAPKKKDLKEVAKGSKVKICNGKERFWVQVESRTDDLFLGHIRNKLLFSSYTYGDMIAFEENNIYDIL